MTIIGQRIKQARNDKNLTQQELAERINISRSAVSNWESGRNYPDLDSIVLLSDSLNLSLDQLLREDATMVKKVSLEQRKGKKRKIYLRILLPLFIILLIFTGYTLYQENAQIHDIISPNSTYQLQLSVRNKPVRITTFRLDNFLYRKEIINDVASEHTIEVRIIDNDNHQLLDKITLKPGESKKLSSLKYRKDYQLYVVGTPGQYFLNIV
ncbi:helix-turn-helix domain-containing protein [Lapidilactobacillus gannanensis]|uniref:Helix-turn-helix domain-containing protein n=1 Tax=Lapidilactobacillus gannanensis TaxID=2486002 RepID=A0ABW4BKC3_9LACO|nr:helix-turn-helix transcriptional regulator [Lapidilactobacillus gannanensis]